MEKTIVIIILRTMEIGKINKSTQHTEKHNKQ